MVAFLSQTKLIIHYDNFYLSGFGITQGEVQHQTGICSLVPSLYSLYFNVGGFCCFFYFATCKSRGICNKFKNTFKVEILVFKIK